MELRLVVSGSAFSNFATLDGYLTRHGHPVASYGDKHTVFRIFSPSEHMTGTTQFGRAQAELQTEILCASSNQTQGCV